MSRRYRCPHCKATQTAAPSADKATTVTCSACQRRFRVPRAKGPIRRQTSFSQQAVRAEKTRNVEAMRRPDDKERLEQIVSNRRLGDYDILDELGRGGMGVVYKAYHRNLKRMVALKVVLLEASESQEVMIKRFKREAELHARFDHPNIVNVYDSGIIDDIHYFAMDFITGTQLTKLVGSPEFTLEHRLDVIRQVADAIHHAHGHGVVHRDIKPDNIIVDPGWMAHLVDFGIAKPTDMAGQENITRQGLAIGTPHYMAPETFRPKLGEVGPRSDLYSLGAVLYHTLCGTPPFEDETAHGVLIKAATKEAPSLTGQITPSEEQISSDAAAIVAKCMCKRPDERYQTGQLVAEDINRLLRGREVSANPLSETERLSRLISRNKGTVGVFSAMVTGLTIVIAASLTTIVATNTAFRALESSAKTLETTADELSKHSGGDDMSPLFSSLQTSAKDLTKMASESDGTGLIPGLIAVGVAMAMLLACCWLMVVRIRRNESESLEPINARPDEIGATADEV